MFRNTVHLINLFKNSPKFVLPKGQFLSTSPRLAMASNQFEEAKQKLSSLQEDPGNDVKLKLYALYKQATIGHCNTPKPGMMDFVAKAKWQAWTSLGHMSKDEAEKQYITIVEELVKADSPAPEASSSSPSESKFAGLDISTRKDGITVITLNRPAKKNSLTPEMYQGISATLKTAAKDPDCRAVLITGNGDYFCSGNDLSNFTKIPSKEAIPKMAADSAEMLKDYVGAYIDFPKVLIGGINGPAVGIAVTVLGLFDIVYASDNATFHTPFSHLGQSPEGCSSVLFPRIMGSAKANKLLMLNHKISAQEALNLNLVTELLPHDKFQEELESRVSMIASLPFRSLMYAKQLGRDVDKAMLHQVNAAECARLVERWQSEDCLKALAAFFSRKSSL